VVGAAYNNNFAGAKSTTLFDIDLATGSLVTQGVGGGVAPNTPNAGGLFTVGPLGISPAPTGQADIEIFDETQDAVASFNVGGVAQLYSINLQTGAATLIGTIGTGTDPVIAISGANFGPASGQNDGATTTNAASFAMNTVAPDSIAAVFGKFQTM